MKYLLQPLNWFAVVFLVLFAQLEVVSQSLLLRAPSQYSLGEAECRDLAVGIYSENWRVRKGDVFAVNAVQWMGQKPDLKYTWTVANGRIVSGQGTSKIEVKAGGTKTPGYINISGLVGVTLLVERNASNVRCEVRATTSIMVG